MTEWDAALIVLALSALAAGAAAWLRVRRKRSDAANISFVSVESDGDIAGQGSDIATSTGPTELSVADGGASSSSGSSTYGHVFDTMLGEGISVSPAEPGTRALRSLAPGGASLVMTRATHKVGRSRSNDLRLADPSVSRVHAEFHLTEQGEYEVRDLQSLNGLFVNGRKRRGALLEPGDRVELGDARLDYVATALGDA